MKVLQILGHYYPVIGGKEKAVLHYSKELESRGHNVEILASDLDRRGKRVKANLCGSFEGIKYRLFRGFFMLGPTAVFFPGIIWYLLTKKYDKIITNTYRQPQTDMALICAKLRGKKCYLMTHNPMVHKRKGFNKIFIFFYDRLIAPITLRFYDAIICLSKESFPFFKKFGVKDSRLFSIPLGVEDKFFKKLPLNENPYLQKNKNYKIILNVGTYGFVKGQDLLIRAITYLKHDYLVYFIGSDDGFKKTLVDLTNELGLSNIHILDAKSPDELMSYYQFADLFVLPSRSEGFGIVVLEALASGLSVVVTSKGLVKSIINDKVGSVVDSQNIVELANSIEIQLKKPHFKEDSIRLAQKYTWSEAGLKLNKILLHN